jgi:hypothetical protein
MTTIAERVQAGHAWLKTNRPDKIPDIDKSLLDVSDPLRCPLGQTGGYYAKDIPVYNLDDFDVWTVRHGFALSDEEYVLGIHTYAELTQEWLKVL